MSAACSARSLGDEHVRSSLERRFGSLDIANGLQPENSAVVGPIDQVGRHPHVERDRRWPEIETGGKGVLAERSARVIDGKGPIGAVPHDGPLLPELWHRTHRSPEAGQAARRRRRHGEFDFIPGTERRDH